VLGPSYCPAIAPPADKSEAAVAAWRHLLGSDRVVVVAPELAASWPSTTPDAHGPAGAIRVHSTEEVTEVVRIAAEHGVALYPTSRGKNWGFGDACPSGPGQFVLDLSGMDRIREVDPELAYAVVEPGVTQRQLHAHLTEHGGALWAPCTSSSPDASLIGNLLERGVGATTQGEAAASVCGLEVVLADGSVVRTGLDRYPKANGHVHRWGVGPYVEGLFLQSSLGVVVRAGIWLMPRPEAFAVFTLAIHDDANLEPAVDALRRLRLTGVLDSPVRVVGAVRTLADRGSVPWTEERPRPLTPAVAQEMLRRYPIAWSDGRWNVTGCFYGSHGRVRAAIADTKAALGQLGHLELLTPLRLRRIERRARVFASLGSSRARRRIAAAHSARSSLAPLQGVPVEGGLDVCRWGLREVPDGHCVDPVQEGCGLYFLAPVAAATGSEIRRCVELLEREIGERGFDPLVELSLVEERAAHLTALLAFDRRDAGQAARAASCHRDLSAKLIEQGFPLRRVGVTAMNLLDPNRDSFWETVGSLKGSLDPDSILAPGRYERRATASAVP
jgi:4-cresol dehydrogenase (hydroxylating)